MSGDCVVESMESFLSPLYFRFSVSVGRSFVDEEEEGISLVT